MCGIAGFCNLKDRWQETIEQMNQSMFHRGPDAGGFYCNDEQSVVFGHRRLSIVDLSPNGAQPMTSHSGDLVMVFNGEIYNYKTIADKLKQDGFVKTFRGSSDTEVLLEAMEAYGIRETIAMSKGMFAIAVYNKRTGEINLIRDRIGEKPLHYGMVGGSFVFASDLKSISAMHHFSNAINQDVLNLYFVHGYIPAPYTIYQNIFKLEAGTILTIQRPYRDYKVSSYWSVMETAKKGQENQFKGSFQEASHELERLLKISISGQMEADVPVGAFLSAGIDSSTIVALMQSLNQNKVRTFTIGMQEEGFNEAVIAKEIAKHLGTQHTELYISEGDAKQVIPRLADIFAEPFADSSQIPTYLVSKMTREHVTVSLSGDGGDELFCGYGTYESISTLWNKMRKVPYPVRKLCSQIVLHTPLKNDRDTCVRGTLLGARGPEDLYEISNQEEPLAKQIARNQTQVPYKYNTYPNGYLKEANHNIMLMDMLMYHPDDILVKVDRSAMAVSLETRVPMLDQDVVEFAWSLPLSYKKEGEVRKRVLRNILYRYVPREMMERPKTGFSIPIEKWLREPELKAWAEMLLDKETIKKQGLLDAAIVEKIWKDFTEKGIWRVQIWYLLMFQEWLMTIPERTMHS